MNYYNEIDPFAANWLRHLMLAGSIPVGYVDERSIEDIQPHELKGYTQCHFFAGIGGWPLALRLAGWPDDKPVWTGSCPCQPFSAAGKGTGFDDERHLWPSFQWLVQQCQPPVVFGEQVASKATGPWFDLVQADLEAMGYAFGLVPFPAAGVGAPHIRDRAYWVGHSSSARGEAGLSEQAQREKGFTSQLDDRGSERIGAGQRPPVKRDGGMGDACSQSSERDAGSIPRAETQSSGAWYSDGRHDNGHSDAGEVGRLADACDRAGQPRKSRSAIRGLPEGAEGNAALRTAPTNGFWRAADWLGCRDGKWRPVEPGTFPLVDGVSARVGRLRGYGNAIVPQAAQAFIESYQEITACK